MSLILDALNKADRDRDANTTPGLDTEHIQPSGPRRPRKRWPMIGLSTTLLLVICALTYWWLTPASQTTDRLASNRQVTPSESATATANNNKQESSLKQQQKTFIAAQYARQKALQTAREQEKQRQHAHAEATRETLAVTELYHRDAASAVEHQRGTRPAPATTPPPVETVETDTPQENELAYYDTIGSVRDLPFASQDALPTLMYSQHNYSQADKSVVINRRQFRENNTVTGELVLEKILKDGIILSYRGQRFKMKAYNNWINL